GLPDATPETREDIRLEEATVQVLDLAAPTADEVVVVRREGLRQLVATLALRSVGRANQPNVAEKLHGAVDGDEVDALAPKGAMELGDRAGLLSRRERGQHRPPRRGDAVTAPRQKARDCVPRILESGTRGSGVAHCVL